jgi:hypothetical protein
VLAVHQSAVDHFVGAKIAKHCAVTADNGSVDKVCGIAPFMFEIKICSSRCNGEMTALSLKALDSFKIALDGCAVIAEKSAVKIGYYQNVTEICHFRVPV